jgi:hypothetical protein
MLRDDKAQRLKRFDLDEALAKLEMRVRAENPDATDDMIVDRVYSIWKRLTSPTPPPVKVPVQTPKIMTALERNRLERQAEKAKRRSARKGG